MKADQEIRKFCPDCKQHKTLDEFHRNRTQKHGRQHYCKPCWYKRTQIQHAKKDQRYHKTSHLRRTYGITMEDWERMRDEQGGGCAICGIQVGDSYRKLAVDHCHESGAIRGLLCNLCNRMIGHAHDDPETLRRAADYLERHR